MPVPARLADHEAVRRGVAYLLNSQEKMEAGTAAGA